MSDEQKFRAMDWLIGVATTVALLIASGSLVKLIEVSERVSVIESTRFTDEDARQIITPQLQLILLKLERVEKDIERLGNPQ